VRGVIRVRILIAGTLAALATAAVGSASPAAAAGNYWRDCGQRIAGEATIVETKSHAVRCKLARKIGKKYALGDRHPIGFDCTAPEPEPSSGFEVSKGVCRREGARVKVIFGV
jgi:hypothetical protein